MKTVVISLGGSLIIPEGIDTEFLERFRKEVRKHYNEIRFVVVCGGGSIARKYIDSLKKEGKSEHEISLAGIRTTRMNALFLMQFFGKEANDKLPMDMVDVKNNLHKNKIVVCGALRITADSTSDGTAARLAHFLKCDFINMTNVEGLYTKDPKKYDDAEFVREISWEGFKKIIDKIKFRAGQHFVLDQEAAKIIEEHKINTYIIGKDTKNIGDIIHHRKFKGTLIAR